MIPETGRNVYLPKKDLKLTQKTPENAQNS
jgi:hypothetical protein